MTLDQAGKEKALVSSVIGHFNKSRALGVSEQRDIIRKELFLYGPTTIAFPVTEEFLHYESGTSTLMKLEILFEVSASFNFL